MGVHFFLLYGIKITGKSFRHKDIFPLCRLRHGSRRGRVTIGIRREGGTACGKPRQTEEPVTNTAAFTEIRQKTGESKREETKKTAFPVALRRITMQEGGEAALCVFASGEAEREGDSLTSVGAGMVLSSTAVRLGEHGTVHELAEGELFRWAYASEFDALRFTHPIALSAERCMVHLRLTNARVGMEQIVFYTALGGGLARVDRLWRTFAGKGEASPAFDAAAAALAAK